MTIRTAILTTLLVLGPVFSAAVIAEETETASTESLPFSHADWTDVLERFVDDEGLVDYAGLAANRAVLDRYLRSIEAPAGPESEVELFHTPYDALAYYINAYNAHVVAGVLERGPDIDSVWGPLGTGFGFFTRYEIVVDGEKTNLKKFEEDTILAGFREPRVHAALNCASISCPRLRREAYVGRRLDEQLDAAVREWVNDPAHVQIDFEEGKVRLNEIFDWFSEDFVRHGRERGLEDPTVLDFVNHFRDTPVPDGLEVEFLDYNKGLNSQHRR